MTVQYGFFGDNATAAIDCLLKGQYVSGSCGSTRARSRWLFDLPKGKRRRPRHRHVYRDAPR